VWCGDVDVLRHTGIGSTLSLTEATVTTITSGQVQLAGSGSGVHGDGLADDEAIADELADGLTGVGVRDLADLVGVEPDLALAAPNDGCGEALLSAEIDPAAEAERQVSKANRMRTSSIKCDTDFHKSCWDFNRRKQDERWTDGGW
jgi:hypothetical protein